jgi:phosphatidylserine/phosphatidylglycerophosphate/cardiolipin synthase-like enzyme
MMHAKYIVIDHRLAVVGSHNWSFGAFADNVELSLVIDDTGFARQVEEVFDTDYLAPEVRGQRSGGRRLEGDVSGVRLVVTSPEGLPDTAALSTVEAMRQVFEAAHSTLDIEVNSLTTRVDFGNGKRFSFVDSLLRDADKRRVRVRLLVDRWALEQEPGLVRSLDSLEHVEVKVINIEAAGPNPKRGTVHAKLVIGDTSAILLGSATFSQRQLLECRNLGVLLEDESVGAVLCDLFERNWFSVFARSP